MRLGSDIYQPFDALTGAIEGSGTGGDTSYGNSIDTNGFAEMMAVLTVGTPGGTNAAPCELHVKFQESDAAKDATWSDIQDGAINGTTKFDALVMLANTTYSSFRVIGEKLSDGNRKRFIRCHAAVYTTANQVCMVPFGVSVLLGRPSNTLNVSGATTQGTGNLAAQGGLFTTDYT